MTRARAAVAVSVGLAVAYLAGSPSPIAPVAWEPPASPGLTGDYEPNAALSSIELLPINDGHGPESIIAGPDGWLYTGLKGGRIVRFRPDGSGMQRFADTGGRANGMAFDAGANLIVADSFKGLLSVSPEGNVSVLAEGADGQRFVFADGLDIAADGTIWFTDATSRFPDGEFHYEVLEGAATGRLLSYDPRTGETRTRVAGLRFPNGVALGPDDAFILVNETLGYRTLRHWIRGPKAGRTEVFVASYPAFPDDIRFNDDGLFWVAMNAYRMAWVDRLQPHPALKSILAKTVGWCFPDTDTHWLGSGGFVIALDLNGNVVRNLQDPERRYVTSTGVLEHQGYLYLGSVVMDAVGRIAVPQATE
jgi:sugar lactone lactonase YvrE